jgi:GDP-L-fucose synthase
MSGFYKGKSAVVCGGGGFLGSHVVDGLLKQGAKVKVSQRSRPVERLGPVLDQVEFISADLTDLEQCRRAVAGSDVVFNTAAQVGGIQYNRVHPGMLFYANASLGLHLLEASRLENVERFVLTSSTCVYPSDAPVPTREEYGLVGEPELNNIGYGWAKRTEELAGRFYAEEYGLSIATVRPTNLYGPRDHFDPEVSHVIPALIKRVMEVDDVLDVWGDGGQTRSFLYVEDAADALLAAGEQLMSPEAVNVGTDEEVTIKELVDLIIQSSGRKVEPRFDPSAPVGQIR